MAIAEKGFAAAPDTLDLTFRGKRFSVSDDCHQVTHPPEKNTQFHVGPLAVFQRTP